MDGTPNTGFTLQGILTVLGLIGAGVAFMFSKQTVDALITLLNWWVDSREKAFALRQKYRKQLMDEEEHKARMHMLDEELNDKGHKYVIRKQDRRITELENENRLCQEKYIALSTKHDMLEEDYQQTREEVSSLKQRLEALAPGIGNATDSQVARFMKRLQDMKARKEREGSGEVDLDNNK